MPLVNVNCSDQKNLRPQKFARLFAAADDIAFLEFDLRFVLKSSSRIAGIDEPAAVFALGCNDLFADQPLRQLNVRNYVHNWQHHTGEKFGGVALVRPAASCKDGCVCVWLLRLTFYGLLASFVGSFVGSLVCWLVRWFVGSLVRWFVGSLVRWFVGSLVRWFVGLVRWLVGSFVGSFDGSFVRSFVASLFLSFPFLSTLFIVL